LLRALDAVETNCAALQMDVVHALGVRSQYRAMVLSGGRERWTESIAPLAPLFEESGKTPTATWRSDRLRATDEFGNEFEFAVRYHERYARLRMALTHVHVRDFFYCKAQVSSIRQHARAMIKSLTPHIGNLQLLPFVVVYDPECKILVDYNSDRMEMQPTSKFLFMKNGARLTL
jgi:hypothetical protein